MGHIKIKGIVNGNVPFPTPKSLTDMKAGLSYRDTIKIIILAFQSLSQTITAERAKHAGINMRLDQTGRLVPPKNPHRENISGVEYLQWHISAEVTNHLPTSSFFPLLSIIMSSIHTFFKPLWHSLNPPLINSGNLIF
jgi:hypothetical protein